MATLIKGILSFNLDWQFVFVGIFLAIVMELCGIKSLSFAVGAYLPLSTTLPIFAGGVVKGLVDWKSRKKAQPAEEDDLGKGNLFATGLVAGGALAGVAVALLTASSETLAKKMEIINFEHGISQVIGENAYMLLGVMFFLAMAIIMYRVAIKKSPDDLKIDT
jgi:uncharacterized oligopeptide transporter (OPT) family protein